MRFKSIFIVSLSMWMVSATADVVQVGSGSYTTSFPGVDEAKRNSYPTGNPRVIGDAATKPIPTNDWWSNQLYTDHASNLFNYPLTMRTTDAGLVIIKNMWHQASTADSPVEVTVEGVTSTPTNISDYSDWTVTMQWGDSNNNMQATTGVGMPFVYFTKNASGKVKINASMGAISIVDNIVVVSGSYNKANYAIYAPAGSKWEQSGTTLTSDLAGKNYWSVALLPDNASSASSAAEQWKQYAYAFPADTKTQWNYDEKSGKVTTQYIVTPDIKEGDGSFLMGLLPHHWAHLSSGATSFTGDIYATVRGELRMMAANSFSTELTFHGILPTMPSVQTSQSGFSQEELNRLVKVVNDDNGLVDWTDSYNDGQLLNRLVQTARVAKESGNDEGFQTAFNLVKNQVEKWLTYTEGEVAFVFYYHKPWTAMLGYPAGHGQDNLINDHHFHWGYFIHAAAFLEQYEPGWADKFGEMINLLIRDAASTDRNDDMFPYLRSFSPYAGHCWANGVAALTVGNDQESSSESMQFHSSLIHWGSLTGDDSIRDLGIYMYVTEQTAVEEYWFDAHNRNLPSDYPYAVVSRVFTNGYDSENFWGGGIAGSYGIELYPIHAGSFYLMNEPTFAKEYWTAIEEETGILGKDDNPNLWHDVMYQFLSMMDAEKAIELYNSYPERTPKFGVSPAQTYQWIHAMAQLGQFDNSMTADHPLAMAFTKNGIVTYAAQNYSDSEIVVTFSDGYQLTVPANTLATGTAKSSLPIIEITAPADLTRVEPGDVVTISADASVVTDATITSVEFFVNESLIATVTEAPYQCTWSTETIGSYTITAKATTSEGKSKTSSAVTLNVGVGGSSTTTDGACAYSSTEASQGSFTSGYNISFRTVKGKVVVNTTLLDPKTGLVGFVWDQTNGFAEYQMANEEGQTLSFTIPTEYADGTTVRIAVKYAFAGGMAVTKTFDYVVGSDCGDSSDTTPDESEDQGGTTSNGSCTFTDSEATQGAFTDSYTIDIKTVEGKIVVTTSLVEEKVGLVAFIFDYTTGGLVEQQMENVGGQTFTGTIATKYPDGTTAKIAVKFAFTGGMAVTKAFDYIVGSACESGAIDDLLDDTKARLFPNPATSVVNIQLPTAGHLYAWNAAGNLVIETDVDANDTINIDNWASGIYFFRIETAEGILVTRLIKE